MTADLRTALASLRQPVAVFDAGIGSFAAVQLIAQHFPWLDLIYFADRASFPYGEKTKPALTQCILSAAQRLCGWGAGTVVLASNAPSVMVLDDVRALVAVPVLGVYPPVQAALKASRSGKVAVMGVASLASSSDIRDYLALQAPGRHVAVVNASPMVELVESGAFLHDAAHTQSAVDAFMQALVAAHPGVDVCTLSSTHLPWLRAYFERAQPGITFLDPALRLVEELRPLLARHPCAEPSQATRVGQVVCIATSSAAQPLSGLQAMLATLGVHLPLHGVAAAAH